MHRLNNLWTKITNARRARRLLQMAILALVMFVVWQALIRFVHLWSNVSLVIGATVAGAAVDVLARKLYLTTESTERPKTRTKPRSIANFIGFTMFLVASIAYLLYEAGFPADLAIAVWAAASLAAAVAIVRKRFEPGRPTAGSVAATTSLCSGCFAYLATDYGVPPIAALVGWAVLSLAAVAVIVKKRDELERVRVAMREARDRARSNI